MVFQKNNLITEQWYVLPLLWLQLATSFIVFIEPAPYDVVGIGLFGLCFSVGLKIPVHIRTGLVLFGIFILANIVASVASYDPVITLKSLAVRCYMVISWILFVCLIYENPKAVLDTIWKGYIVAAILCVFVALAGFFELTPFSEQLVEFGRVRALFKDPNLYGPFLVPVALLAFAKLEMVSGYKLVLYACLFVFISFGVLLGFSRGSWINYALSIILFTGLRFATSQSFVQIKRLLIILGFATCLIFIFIIIALSTDKVREMLEIRFQVQSYDVMEGGRLSNQRLILSEALVRPLGVGAYLSEIVFYRAPHNIYLHVLIESGWIGGLAFYAFLIVTLRKAYKFCFQPTSIQRSYMVTFVCTIGILVQSIFIDSTHWRHMYLLFAMLWGPALLWQDEIKIVRRMKNQRIAESKTSTSITPQAS